MSNCPRTDVAAIGFARILIDKNKHTTTELVEANFARTLELELAAAVKERDNLLWAAENLNEELRVACDKRDAANERLRKSREDAEIHLEAANRWSERAMVAELRLREAEKDARKMYSSLQEWMNTELDSMDEEHDQWLELFSARVNDCLIANAALAVVK